MHTGGHRRAILPRMRSPRTLLAALVALPVLTACGGQQAATPPGTQQSNVVATFIAADQPPTGPAITYDSTLLPVGAQATITGQAADGNTTVTLAVTGLKPDRAYGAHVHTRPCGPSGDVAGPHYQHQPDPKTPSTDPAFANPQNEVWLDFRTDAAGTATTTATVPWVFGERRADSVVIHANSTATEPGKAGTAGARIGCVSVRF